MPILCLVTDLRLCRQDTEELESKIAAAVRGGVNLVQLREKDLPTRQLLELGQRLRRVTAGLSLLFVNDRIDVAIACQADGVQLGEQSFPVPSARRLVGDGLLIGRSVHSVEGAVAAERDDADLLIVGTVFASGSHPNTLPMGTELLRGVDRTVQVPFAGIGGVTASNLDQVVDAGAAGVALISGILAAEDPEQAARVLKQALDDAWSESHTSGLAESQAEVGKAQTRSA